jgi:hypothetical protein
MDVDTIDFAEEAGVPVEPGFMHAPVVTGPPVVAKLSDVAKVGAVVPARISELFRPAGAFETVAKIAEDIIRDVDGKRSGRHQAMIRGGAASSDSP